MALETVLARLLPTVDYDDDSPTQRMFDDEFNRRQLKLRERIVSEVLKEAADE